MQLGILGNLQIFPKTKKTFFRRCRMSNRDFDLYIFKKSVYIWFSFYDIEYFIDI